MSVRFDPVTRSLVSIPNWRDLGGLSTADGRLIRPGSLMRSAAIDAPSEADLAALDELGIANVFDLRTASECRSAPDVAPAGSRVLHLDVLADKHLSAPAKMMDLLADPKTVESALDGGKAAELMIRNYRDLVTLPSAVESYRTMVRTLVDDEQPALVHCTSGKDRTGWAAAIVLLAVGADERTVFTDYLHTNELYLPSLSDTFDTYRAAGGDPDDLRALLGVRSDYLQAALDEARAVHGSIDAYLEALGIDDDARARLRTRLLTPG